MPVGMCFFTLAPGGYRGCAGKFRPPVESPTREAHEEDELPR